MSTWAALNARIAALPGEADVQWWIACTCDTLRSLRFAEDLVERLERQVVLARRRGTGAPRVTQEMAEACVLRLLGSHARMRRDRQGTQGRSLTT